MSAWAAAISAAGSLGSSAMNIRAATKQQQRQKNLSDTAHQREIKDLKKAGLNPILTIKGAGATSPHGPIARTENPVPQMGELSTKQTIASAQAAQAKQAVLTQKSQTELNSAQAIKAQAETNVSKNQLQLQNAQTKKELEQAKLNSATATKTHAEAQKKIIVGEGYKEAGKTIIPAIKKSKNYFKSTWKKIKEAIKRDKQNLHLSRERRKKNAKK